MYFMLVFDIFMCCLLFLYVALSCESLFLFSVFLILFLSFRLLVQVLILLYCVCIHYVRFIFWYCIFIAFLCIRRPPRGTVLLYCFCICWFISYVWFLFRSVLFTSIFCIYIFVIALLF